MRELALRYAQTATDLEHPAPHWDLVRERRILADQRAELAAAAGWFADLAPAPRTEAAIDALCAAACVYFTERAAYLRAPGRPDYTACAAAWSSVEAAARAL